MNIEQANRIPMSEILAKIGSAPHKSNDTEGWYLSPLRAEKTPSFHVHYRNNVWYDFGLGIGGDVVAFVCAFLKASHEDDTVPDALRWIRNMQGILPIPPKLDTTTQCHTKDPTLVLKDVKPIQSPGLIKYLGSRGISLNVAQRHLKEIVVFNKHTNKCMYALGFPNEDGGYELRNPFFKGCIGSKDVSFIRGNGIQPKTIHLFEGFFDYLTVTTHQANRTLESDVIVLNSVSCLQKAIGFIKGFDYQVAYSWMDNDPTGIEATQYLDAFFKSESQLTHLPQNSLYAPHKDVNAWHMHTLKLAE